MPALIANMVGSCRNCYTVTMSQTRLDDNVESDGVCTKEAGKRAHRLSCANVLHWIAMIKCQMVKSVGQKVAKAKQNVSQRSAVSL